MTFFNNSSLTSDMLRPSDDGYDGELLDIVFTHILMVISGIGGVLGVVGNILAVGAVVAGPARASHTTASCDPARITYHFMASLAMSDIIAAITFSVSFVTSVGGGGRWILGQSMCAIIGFFLDVTFLLQYLNMTVIAVNRYACIIHPRHYRHLYAPSVVAVMILLTWLIPISQRLPVSLMPGELGHVSYDPKYHVCYHRTNSEALKVLYRLCVAVPMVVTLICYVAILVRVTRSRRNMERTSSRCRDSKRSNNSKRGGSNWSSTRSSVRSSVRRQRVRRVEVTLALQFFLIYFLSVVVSVPYLVLSIPEVYVVAPLSCHMLVVVGTILNSCVNPPIYWYFNPKFRNDFKRTYRWCYRSRGQRGEFESNPSDIGGPSNSQSPLRDSGERDGTSDGKMRLRVDRQYSQTLTPMPSRATLRTHVNGNSSVTIREENNVREDFM